MEFRERILTEMERKKDLSLTYFYWYATKEQFKRHCLQEFALIVNPFTDHLEDILAHNPPNFIAGELRKNLQEEKFGTISGFNKPHKELYLDTMEALGYQSEEFFRVKMVDSGKAFDRELRYALRQGWLEGMAGLNIVVEGTWNDRMELQCSIEPVDIENVVQRHYLHVHHGVPLGGLNFKRAHLKAEPSHRDSTYRSVEKSAVSQMAQSAVIDVVQTLVNLWVLWRKEVANELPKSWGAHARQGVPAHYRERVYGDLPPYALPLLKT